jgi:hypothetical protein
LFRALTALGARGRTARLPRQGAARAGDTSDPRALRAVGAAVRSHSSAEVRARALPRCSGSELAVPQGGGSSAAGCACEMPGGGRRDGGRRGVRTRGRHTRPCSRRQPRRGHGTAISGFGGGTCADGSEHRSGRHHQASARGASAARRASARGRWHRTERRVGSSLESSARWRAARDVTEDRLGDAAAAHVQRRRDGVRQVRRSFAGHGCRHRRGRGERALAQARRATSARAPGPIVNARAARATGAARAAGVAANVFCGRPPGAARRRCAGERRGGAAMRVASGQIGVVGSP